MQATSGNATLTLADGRTVPLINIGVLVVPSQNADIATSQAVVTQGNREPSTTGQMTAEMLHARFSHRRAE
eukprot:1232574-Pleurochrysis_carterae.AAC.1